MPDLHRLSRNKLVTNRDGTFGRWSKAVGCGWVATFWQGARLA